MEVKRRLYTVDDVLDLLRKPGNSEKRYELVDGELIETSPANLLHFWLASELSGEIRNYLMRKNIGIVGVEGAFSPPGNRQTFLVPDVAFISSDRISHPLPSTFAGFMPDLAVEIASPSNTVAELREKAAMYLRNGTRLVWILYPDRKGAEVCRIDDEAEFATKSVGADGKLDGEDVLPGFELELRQLFGD